MVCPGGMPGDMGGYAGGSLCLVLLSHGKQLNYKHFMMKTSLLFSPPPPPLHQYPRRWAAIFSALMVSDERLADCHFLGDHRTVPQKPQHQSDQKGRAMQLQRNARNQMMLHSPANLSPGADGDDAL